MVMVRPLALAALLALGLPLPAAEPGKDAKEPPAAVSYYRDVRPILQQHCQGCHQPAIPKGGFAMIDHDDLFKKGESDQPGVVPGKPEVSKVVEQITAHDGKRPIMPKGQDPLIDHDVETIKKWIAQGAKDDTPAAARAVIDAEHPPSYALAPVITSLDYSPDGSLLAVAGYHEVLVHKAGGSGLVARLVGLSERVQKIAFSPDGKQLAVAAGDPCRFGEIQVWDVAHKKLKLSVPITFDTVYGVSWAPDGSKIAFGCADNTLRAIDAVTGKQVLYSGAHNDWVLDTVFSSDGEYLASVSRDMSMRLTEVATQRFIDNITSITPGALKGGLITVARRPLPEKALPTLGASTTGLLGSPQGRAPLLAATALFPGRPDDRKFVKSPPDPKDLLYQELVVGGSDGTPRLYKMHRETKRVIGDDANRIREFAPMPGRVFAVSCSPDGNFFVAGSSLDGTGEARVYQIADGKLVAKLEAERGAVYAVAFRPDGKQVASAGFDGVVRLGDAQTGKLIKEFVPVAVSGVAQAAGK
jgi:WD40 repeat protein